MKIKRLAPIIVLTTLSVFAFSSCSTSGASYTPVAQRISDEVVVHEEGNLGDQCVLDEVATGVSIVGLAVAPPVGAVAVIVSFTGLGISAYSLSECQQLYQGNVLWWMLNQRVVSSCAPFGWAPDIDQNCIFAGYAAVEIIATAIVLGIYLLNHS